MKRLVYVYLALAASLLVATLLWVGFTHAAGTQVPLRKLGKGEREFREARQHLLLSTTDPSPRLLAYASNPKNKTRARVQALRILKDLGFHGAQPQAGRQLAPLLRTDSPELTRAALEAFGALKSTDSLDAIRDVFRTETDSALFLAAARSLREISLPTTERLTAALRVLDLDLVDSCADALAGMPVGFGVTGPLLAAHYARTGDIEKGGEIHRGIGFVPSWWVMGAFPNPRVPDWVRDRGPESTPFDPAQTFPVEGSQTVGWFLLNTVPHDGRINLSNMLSPNERAVCYLHTYVISPDEREAVLMVGSDDGIKAWLNQQTVVDHWINRPDRADDDVARIRLRQGANSLLLKIGQDLGSWGAVCRVTGFDGRAMDDVVFSPFPDARESSVDSVVSLAARGVSVDTLARTLGLDNRKVVSALLGVAGDESVPSKRRVAALNLLRAGNAVRAVPVGEAGLIALATELAERVGGGPVLVAAVDALATMRSLRALDLALLLRRSEGEAERALAEKLVTAYCTARLSQFEGIAEKNERPDYHRTIHDIESLQPTDSAVVKAVRELRNTGTKG